MHTKSLDIKWLPHSTTLARCTGIQAKACTRRRWKCIYTKLLDIKTRILGGDSHLLVAETGENMADIYADQGK